MLVALECKINDWRSSLKSRAILYEEFCLFLDVEDIKFVINFDYPNCSEDYVHRIGRTGRASNIGTAYTLFTPKNGNKARDLIGVLTEAKQQISPKLLQLQSSSRDYGKG